MEVIHAPTFPYPLGSEVFLLPLPSQNCCSHLGGITSLYFQHPLLTPDLSSCGPVALVTKGLFIKCIEIYYGYHLGLWTTVGGLSEQHA